MKRVEMKEIASIIRSKNSGPYELTLDVFFKDKAVYESIKRRNAVTPEMVMALYHVKREEILDIIYFDPVSAVKITIARPMASGAVNDTDIYGAQQHMPLVTALVEVEETI